MQLGQFRCDNFACDRQKLKHECPRNALIGRATHGNAIHAQCDAVQTFYHCWIVRVGGKSKLPGLDIDMVVTTMFALGYAIVNAEGSKWKFLDMRSEEHTSELQSLMRISYAVLCLKKKNKVQIENNPD